MKSTHRNIALAAVAALTFTVAPSALADMRFHMSLPLPPPPHEVLRHLPAPPLPPFVDFRHERRDRCDSWYGNRWSCSRDRHAYVEGRWVARPYRRAVWVGGHHDRWGRWVPGCWTRTRYR